jgi:hypothetical protein
LEEVKPPVVGAPPATAVAHHGGGEARISHLPFLYPVHPIAVSLSCPDGSE